MNESTTCIVPIAMTLAEAVSPHTWDGPLLYFVGGAGMVAVLEIAATLPPGSP